MGKNVLFVYLSLSRRTSYERERIRNIVLVYFVNVVNIHVLSHGVYFLFIYLSSSRQAPLINIVKEIQKFTVLKHRKKVRLILVAFQGVNVTGKKK